MSETAATAWIIEHLEIENAKMEEEMGSMETCEDDFVGIVSGTIRQMCMTVTMCEAVLHEE